MKAKFLTLIAAAIIASGTLFAQEKKQAPTPEQRIEKRTERMQKRLMLDDATAAKFAPIYKEYLKAKADCRTKCKKCENPTDAQIKENIAARLEAEKKAIEVEQKYYKKLSSILSGRQLQQIFCKDKQPKFNKEKKGNFGKHGKQAPRFNGKKPGKDCPMMRNCPQHDGKCPMQAPKYPKSKECPKAPANAPVAPVK